MVQQKRGRHERQVETHTGEQDETHSVSVEAQIEVVGVEEVGTQGEAGEVDTQGDAGEAGTQGEVESQKSQQSGMRDTLD